MAPETWWYLSDDPPISDDLFSRLWRICLLSTATFGYEVFILPRKFHCIIQWRINFEWRLGSYLLLLIEGSRPCTLRRNEILAKSEVSGWRQWDEVVLTWLFYTSWPWGTENSNLKIWGSSETWGFLFSSPDTINHSYLLILVPEGHGSGCEKRPGGYPTYTIEFRGSYH
jgi:hypothetical protein